MKYTRTNIKCLSCSSEVAYHQKLGVDEGLVLLSSCAVPVIANKYECKDCRETI